MPLFDDDTGGIWQPVTIGPEFVNAGDPFPLPACRKDSLSMVHLKGTIVYVGGLADVIFTLPLGFRPPSTLRFMAFSGDINGSASICWIDINSSGEGKYVGGAAYSVAFDQISFATY